MERDTPPITMISEDPKLGGDQDQAREDLRDEEGEGKGKRPKTIQQSFLPEDILIKILFRFPVKTLVQLRCVCKFWKTLISNPIFVKEHLRASIQDEGYAHHRIIMTSRCRAFDVKSCSLAPVLHDESPDIIDHFYPLKHPTRSVMIVGSVNGLVCIAIDQGSVFLWNPSTRKSKRLPNCGIKKSPGDSIVYGFGYDESSSEYKVMVINCRNFYPRYSSPYLKTDVRIYGWKSDSWRNIDCFPNNNFPLWGASAMFVSGSLHWATSDNCYQWRTTGSIVSFDLLKETYSVFSQPLYRVGASDSTLGVLCDCLCLLCNYMGYEEADVWVMKEYGKVDSWSKLFTIPYFPIELGSSSKFSVPLCFSFKENEVLLVLGSCTVLYNIISDEVCLSDIHNCLENNIDCRFKAYTYIESLVSPYPEKMQ